MIVLRPPRHDSSRSGGWCSASFLNFTPMRPMCLRRRIARCGPRIWEARDDLRAPQVPPSFYRASRRCTFTKRRRTGSVTALSNNPRTREQDTRTRKSLLTSQNAEWGTTTLPNGVQHFVGYEFPCDCRANLRDAMIRSYAPLGSCA